MKDFIFKRLKTKLALSAIVAALVPFVVRYPSACHVPPAKMDQVCTTAIVNIYQPFVLHVTKYGLNQFVAESLWRVPVMFVLAFLLISLLITIFKPKKAESK